ncbi:nucleotidyl transferase AbiEii/AbiGii toxin family protein [Bradyrhizobium iriomotense]|uniref:nucleotidyl transferase AbiEii/AbiGii toxin family protein n=1 Tax=Bradyrhizobium iriomotense TaxID=441950 RepID=UPI001FEE34A1|nr:nucleotidyl transferase AbiEii/AbiGii toxin family protein [Bradyrhizobium iriomotense]
MNAQSDWAQLFRIACAMIRHVNAEQNIIDHWTFGGGTAMMLQIDHRISQDVDIFLPDPQVLPFLDPQKHDFNFEIRPADYNGDGARSLKLSFEFGQIDFIVATSLTSSPTTQATVEGEMILLETIPEIIAKKIYHRGNSITPRDIFDIAASGEMHAESIIKELARYRDRVAGTLATIDKLKPDFVSAAINQLSIKDAYKLIANTALEKTKDLLRAV